MHQELMECHPDRCEITGMTREAAEAAFKKLIAAYTVLETQLAR